MKGEGWSVVKGGGMITNIKIQPGGYLPPGATMVLEGVLVVDTGMMASLRATERVSEATGHRVFCFCDLCALGRHIEKTKGADTCAP